MVRLPTVRSPRRYVEDTLDEKFNNLSTTVLLGAAIIAAAIIIGAIIREG